MSDLKLAAQFEKKSRQDWLDQVGVVLRGADFEKKLVSRTYDDIRVEPLYSRDNSSPGHPASTPGMSPYTRGWTAATEARWEIDQLHADTDPETTNKAILDDLEGGASSLTLRLAAPGQSGLPLTTDAIKTALSGIRLDMISLTFEAGIKVDALPAIIRDLANDRPDEMDNANISLNADPLGTLARLSALDTDMEAGNQKLVNLAKAGNDGLPVRNIVLADARPYHNAGASEAQELACMLATLVAYMRAFENAGITPAQAIPMISVCLTSDTELFASIAKFRAARRLISEIATACGCPDAAPHVKLRAETSERMMTRRDPWVNMLRTTAACAGAALGGACSITVLPFSWALGMPDRLARRMARNCQIILMEEASLAEVIDPVSGSYFADYFTDNLADKSWALFQEIEKNGGMFRSLQSGLIQNMIRETHEARARDIALGKMDITGVSSFPDLAEVPIKVAPHATPEPLDEEAVTVEPLPLRRPSAPFEQLRDAADRYSENNDGPAEIFLANLGTLSDFNARANWAVSFFSTGGIKAITNTGYVDHDALIEAFAKSGTRIACICSTDVIYENEAEEIASRLKSAGATYIYLAGRAGEKRDAYKKAGIDDFIHKGINSLDILADTQDRLDFG